jgi:hypothetical protein
MSRSPNMSLLFQMYVGMDFSLPSPSSTHLSLNRIVSFWFHPPLSLILCLFFVSFWKIQRTLNDHLDCISVLILSLVLWAFDTLDNLCCEFLSLWQFCVMNMLVLLMILCCELLKLKPFSPLSLLLFLFFFPFCQLLLFSPLLTLFFSLSNLLL